MQRLNSNMLGGSVGTPASPGRKPGASTGGIGSLVTGLKELEARMGVLEEQYQGAEERVDEIGDTIDAMRETQLTNTKKAEKAIRECEKVAADVKEMTGGSNNMAAFMEYMKKEKIKTNAKLDKAVKTLDELETKVNEEGGQRGNLLQQMVKKVANLDRGLSDLGHEVKTTHAFKK